MQTIKSRNQSRALFCIGLLSTLVCLNASASLPADDSDNLEIDVLLKQATIFDGSGRKSFTGDVAIRGDRIVAVGQVTKGNVNRTLDCRGLVLTPGFIDLHNHSDRQVVDRKTRGNVNYLMQGCTTVVTGNCGGGPIDVAHYYEEIDTAGAGTNVAHLLPHGSLRSQAMGRAARAPTDDELKEMQELTAKAMDDGAWGMSTGLIYVPGSYAETSELVSLAQIVGEAGGIYASHIRNENTELLAAVNEALSIGRAAQLPVHISHFKSSGQESWGLVRRAAELIEKARASGQRATADQYPYIASSTSLDATLIPTWARAGNRADLIARFEDPVQMKRIQTAIQNNLRKRDEGAVLWIARYAHRQDWVGRNLKEIAAAEGTTPLEATIDIARNGGASIVNFSMSEEDVRHIMQIPWVATASDGRAYIPGADRPHPRNYGTFPRKLGHYALREKVLPLAQAIRSASGLPADILGMTDRGYIKPGQQADIILFDPNQLTDVATFDDPHQYCEGIRYVFVNGIPAVDRGKPTGALAGKALRHNSSISSQE